MTTRKIDSLAFKADSKCRVMDQDESCGDVCGSFIDRNFIIFKGLAKYFAINLGLHS